MTQSNSQTLKRRIVRAGGWTLAGMALSQVLRFGSNLIMTRMLAPDVFGIVAIATIFLVGLTMFSDIGIRQSIVQSRHGTSVEFLNSAWSVQILRGVLLGVLALGVSLLIAAASLTGLTPSTSVYAHPLLPYVVAAMSANALVAGFESTKIAEASRNLSLRRVIQIDLASQLFSLGVMFCWVIIDKSIWALVAGGFTSVLLKVVLSHLLLPGNRNRWHWDRQSVREIIRFGKWIFASSILGFLVINGDRLLLGLFVSSPVLGVYVIAYLIYFSIDQVLSKIIADISFPAFSELVRERPSELKSGYYRIHRVIALFTYFCAGTLMCSGNTLIRLLYDARYAEAGWMLEMLALCLVTVPFRLAGQYFLAKGMPKLLTHTIVIQLVVLFVALPVGFRYFGLTGALWGIVFSSYAALPAVIYNMTKFGLFDVKKELIVLPAVALGALVGNLLNIAIVHAA